MLLYKSHDNTGPGRWHADRVDLFGDITFSGKTLCGTLNSEKGRRTKPLPYNYINYHNGCTRKTAKTLIYFLLTIRNDVLTAPNRSEWSPAAVSYLTKFPCRCEQN